MKMKTYVLLLSILLLSLLAVACAPGGNSAEPTPDPAITGPATASPEENPWRIRVIGPTGGETWSFTETELKKELQQLDSPVSGSSGAFSHVYSTINNWPSSRFYVAEGYCVADILAAVGLYDTAQTVTFRSTDGYEISLTREQLFEPQHFYPKVAENEAGSEPVFPIIAYRWRAGSEDLGSLREENPGLIIGQRNPFEHTNPAFVEDLAEILVSDAPCPVWPAATTFPQPGPIAKEETVKLQHPSYGLVKLHYTLDGSEPTPLSPIYNPSTYQPELNVPIPITRPTVIKVLVRGFGKADSEISVFTFTPQD